MLGALSLAGLPADAAAPVSAGPTAGGWTSDNVEYVAHVPLNYDSPGARLVGKFLYLTTSRDLRVYDVSDPVSPELVGTLAVGQTPYFAQEDVDTNGKILLIGGLVINVRDKSNPTIIGSHSANEHTISCVLGCKWAYGSAGSIVDLRDPKNPKVVGEWDTGMPAQGSHDVTEVAPGLVLTSSQPILLLDARKNPAKPRLLAVGSNEDRRFIHSNLWPRRMKDKFLLVGGETPGPTCGGAAAAFMTWDATRWKKTRNFTMIDEYRVEQGVPTNGDAPANLFCTHWFDTHPTYSNGGLVAQGWYEHGVRFLDINSKGKIKEAGWFVPWGGSTSAAYWIDDEIVYSVDYNRGLDILRFTGKP